MSNALPELTPFSLGENTRLLLPDEDTPNFEEQAQPKPGEMGLFESLKAACNRTAATPPQGFQPKVATVPMRLLDAEGRPRFIPSEEGPIMGEVEPSEPTLGQRLLNELNGAVLNNSMDAETARDLSALVETWQTRLDLAGVGMAAYAVSRVQSVTQMAEDVERHIWARLADLPVLEAINLLKVLHKDRHAFITLIGTRATSPSISSPESLSGGLTGRAEEASKPRVSLIKPEGRKRLQAIMGKIRKVHNTEVVVVENAT